MKTFLQLAFALAALLSPWRGLGQGFVNLNFEAPAQYVPYAYSLYQFNSVIPGWTSFSVRDGIRYDQPWATSNAVYWDHANIGIIDYRYAQPSDVNHFVPPLGHSAIMQPGYHQNDFSNGGDLSLSQTAVVPAGTESLRFVTSLNGSPAVQFGILGVFMNGSRLNLVPLSSTTNAMTWGANLNGWANQQAELRFTLFGQDPYRGSNPRFLLDDIQFSTVAVPEPSTWALLGLGTLFFAHALRRRKSR